MRPRDRGSLQREAPARAQGPLTPTARGSWPAPGGPQSPAWLDAVISLLPGRPRREPWRKRFVSSGAAAPRIPSDKCGSLGLTQTDVLVYGSRLSAALRGQRVCSEQGVCAWGWLATVPGRHRLWGEHEGQAGATCHRLVPRELHGRGRSTVCLCPQPPRLTGVSRWLSCNPRPATNTRDTSLPGA